MLPDFSDAIKKAVFGNYKKSLILPIKRHFSLAIKREFSETIKKGVLCLYIKKAFMDRVNIESQETCPYFKPIEALYFNFIDRLVKIYAIINKGSYIKPVEIFENGNNILLTLISFMV